MLAALLGLNIGSGLTWTGSLANLLWRRTLTAHDAAPGSAAFHRVSLVADAPGTPGRGGRALVDQLIRSFGSLRLSFLRRCGILDA